MNGLIQVVDQHVAVLGKTGCGKTYAMRSLAEQMLDDGRRVCILDPKGDWWGLKSSKTGKRSGYPVVLFGGHHGEVPINRKAGHAVAELIASGHRSAVIDLSEMSIAARTEFFMDFAEGIFRHNRAPLQMIIDEVHNFAPKGKIVNPQAGQMLHWANRLFSEGRGKGIRIIGASQRPQKWHNDAMTCCETLIAMRCVHPADRKAIKDWMDGVGDSEKSSKVLNTLAQMKRGSAWVWSPDNEMFGHHQFGKIKTFDSMAGPSEDWGDDRPQGWAGVDLEEVKGALAEAVAEAEARDPKLLRKRIVDLEKQLAEKSVDQNEIDRQVSIAVQQRDDHWQSELHKLEAAHGSLVDRINKVRELTNLNGDAEVSIETPEPIQRHQATKAAKARAAAPTPPRRQSPNPASNVATSSEVSLGKCEAFVLRAMYWLRNEGATKAKVSFYSGYSIKSSGFKNALSSLRTKGLIEGMKISAFGVSVVEAPGDVEPKPVGADLREWLRPRLGKAENAVLDALIDNYPNRLTLEDVADASGYSATSSGLKNALSTLRSIEAAEGLMSSGGTKASEILI